MAMRRRGFFGALKDFFTYEVAIDQFPGMPRYEEAVRDDPEPESFFIPDESDRLAPDPSWMVRTTRGRVGLRVTGGTPVQLLNFAEHQDFEPFHGALLAPTAESWDRMKQAVETWDRTAGILAGMNPGPTGQTTADGGRAYALGALEPVMRALHPEAKVHGSGILALPYGQGLHPALHAVAHLIDTYHLLDLHLDNMGAIRFRLPDDGDTTDAVLAAGGELRREGDVISAILPDRWKDQEDAKSTLQGLLRMTAKAKERLMLINECGTVLSGGPSLSDLSPEGWIEKFRTTWAKDPFLTDRALRLAKFRLEVLDEAENLDGKDKIRKGRIWVLSFGSFTGLRPLEISLDDIEAGTVNPSGLMAARKPYGKKDFAKPAFKTTSFSSAGFEMEDPFRAEGRELAKQSASATQSDSPRPIMRIMSATASDEPELDEAAESRPSI